MTSMANEESSSAPSSAAVAASAGPATTANATGNSTTTSSKATTTTATSRKKPTVKKATGAGTKAKVKKPSTAGSAATSGTAGTGGSKNAASSNKRKKPVKKDTISVDVVLAEGQAAQQDLAKQREAAAQRQADPLWYRIEDVLVTGSSDAPMVGAGSSSSSHILPEQVVLVERALASSGLTCAHVTPQAMACLLEQARRYAAELLGDAADYAYTAGRPEVTREDLLLAQEMRPDPANSTSSSSVLQQLPKLHLVAQAVNRVPLPAIPAHCYSGVVLPDPQHQLTARTFDVVSTALDWRKRVQPLPLSPLQQQQNKKKSNSSNNNNNNNTSSVGYGVSRGRQIPIHIKERSNPDKDDGGLKPMDTTAIVTAAPTAPALTPTTIQTAASPPNTSTSLTLTQTGAVDTATATTVATGGDATSGSPPNPATPPKPPTQPITYENSELPPPSSSEKESAL